MTTTTPPINSASVRPAVRRPRRGLLHASLPRLIDSSPLADVVATYRRLRAEHDAARAEQARLERERPAAEQADRAALATALAAGKRDPGDQQQDALEEKIAAAQRRVGGLVDATSAALLDVRAAVLGDLGAKWREQLDASAAKLRNDLDEHLAEAVECFERLAGIDASRAWAREAQTGRSVGESGLPPSIRPPKVAKVHISGTPTATNALAVLRDLAATDTVPPATPKLPPAAVVADDAPEVEAAAAA